MSAILSDLGPLLKDGVYNVEFAATRLQTTVDGLGSAFAYRPLKGPDFRAFGDVRPWPSEYTVVFAGCVSEIAVEREPHMPWGSLTVVTLALPPDANIVAQEIMARQDRFLQQISSADVLEAGVSCRTCCGSSSPNFLHTPLNISISFPGNARRVGEAARPIEFNVGDDIICRAALIRVDHDDGKVLTMRYLFRGSVYTILDPAELRDVSS
ncbi:hypothetical protein C8R43DRAFT_1143735 [Mycena crocata]|nr:hypothetical protein C8R43DRAFT_1143735 [Mycena crocata]